MHYPAVIENDFDSIKDLLFLQNRFCTSLLQKSQNLSIGLFLFAIGLKSLLFLFSEPRLKGGLALVWIFRPENALLFAEQNRFIQIYLLNTLDQVVLSRYPLSLILIQGLTQLSYRLFISTFASDSSIWCLVVAVQQFL